jgi:hypothetical protein
MVGSFIVLNTQAYSPFDVQSNMNPVAYVLSLNSSYPSAHSPSLGPSVVWMGPRGAGAGTGTGRGAVSDRNLRGWPGRGLGPGFLKGGWARASTQCRRRCPPGPSSWSPLASSWLLQTWHKSPAKVRCVKGWRSPMPRKRDTWEGIDSPGRGCRVGGLHWSPTLAHKHVWEGPEPIHQLFLRCLLAGLGLRAPEMFLPNI